MLKLSGKLFLWDDGQDTEIIITTQTLINIKLMWQQKKTKLHQSQAVGWNKQ